MSTESNINKLSEELSKLTILEVSELVTILKEKWNVSDAPMMAMAPSASGSAAPKEAEEQTSFNVVLASHGGEKKMDVIRVVREMTGLGLKEAKDLVDGAPKSIKEDVNKKDAEEMKAKLEALGAKVELK